jgi:hypothetical protein
VLEAAAGALAVVDIMGSRPDAEREIARYAR